MGLLLPPMPLSGGQWSIRSATSTGQGSTRTRANAANARAPATMFCTAVPDRNSPPPVETWRIPSACASATPHRAAFKVSDELTFTPASA